MGDKDDKDNKDEPGAPEHADDAPDAADADTGGQQDGPGEGEGGGVLGPPTGGQR